MKTLTNVIDVVAVAFIIGGSFLLGLAEGLIVVGICLLLVSWSIDRETRAE